MTKVRKNLKNRLMRFWDNLLLRERALLETINDHLGFPTQALILSGFSGMLGVTMAFPHILLSKGPEHAH